MLDLDKLWKKLEDALAAETPESLTLWLDEQRRKDREAGIIRDTDIDFLDFPNSTRNLPTDLVEAIDDTMVKDIDYETPGVVDRKHGIAAADTYNLAA